MKNLILVENYNSILDIKDTQVAIKFVKDTFQKLLSEKLWLVRVSAPLFVDPKTGLNDNLSGVEKPVSFVTNETNTNLEIVQSLAKWKRYALNKYHVDGLYTDMNAIRPFEETDNIHSLYVDQWDWEKRISKEDRNLNYLKNTVNLIYEALKETEVKVCDRYSKIVPKLPREIKFITTQELEDLYPNLTSKERENEIAKKYKAVFLIGIGDKLKSGNIHDSRASDYDDWKLNGDILVWYDVLKIALELSSMGIRVDDETLKYQLNAKNENYKLDYLYHKQIINKELPLTIGGGIGQSRICMFFLKKAHIGEVQSSFWSEEEIKLFNQKNIKLL